VHLKLYRHWLRYTELTVHTAASGTVAGLDTLYLELLDGRHRALGEVRINCTYLNGHTPDDLLESTRQALGDFDWRAPPERLRDAVARSPYPAPVRMLLDTALWDLSAQRAGLPLAHLLATKAQPLRVATNQTLFLSEDPQFDRQAAQYVARGFRQLKLRIGQDIAVDCARCARLRAAYGDAVQLAADANGTWTAAQAPARLAALAPFGLRYVEQPIAVGDWQALHALARHAPMPLMLDESLACAADIDRLITCGATMPGQLAGHLKLIKLGGITPTLAAARTLAAAGIDYMIGQMNEGAIATAAALHVAAATQPRYAELYGADGLDNDPAQGLHYAAGQVAAEHRPGLGLTFRAPGAPMFSGEIP